MKRKLKTLFKREISNQELLDELNTLSGQRGFSDAASIWVPVLLKRDANFFAKFLNRHLTWNHRELMAKLHSYLDVIEDDYQFSSIYQRGLTAESWNADLLRLINTLESDEDLLRAIQRREQRWWFYIAPKSALMLYERSPELFSDFIRGHTTYRWWNQKQKSYKKLLEAVQKQGDDELYWHLFQYTATEKEWQAEMKQLLKQSPQDDQILAELERRLPVHHRRTFNATILVDFLKAYGRTLAAFVEKHAGWIARHAPTQLFQAVNALGDEALAWRLFFKSNNTYLWNVALRDLLTHDLTDAELHLALQKRTPASRPGGRWWQQWVLEEDVALVLYQRNRTLFRPFIEQFIDKRIYTTKVKTKLFAAAQEAEDHEFLDFLSFHIMRGFTGLVNQAYPHYYTLRWIERQSPKRRKERQDAMNQARQQLAEAGRVLTGRFDQLFTESPEAYIRHAANIMARFQAFEVWSFQRDITYNPAFNYLAYQHRDAWLRSSDGIRELLESPNIYVQIIGLEMLSEGGPDAAERVRENLMMLRALLIGRARASTKKRALATLDMAARQGHQYAVEILPLLEEAMDLRGKRAIPQPLMVSFVRLRHMLRVQTSEQPVIPEPVYA